MKENKNPFYIFLYNNVKLIFASILIIIISLMSIICFATYYKRLNESIQKERVDYVSEIGTIILEKIQLLSDSYSDELRQTKRLVTSANVDSLSRVNRILGGADDICILFSDGNCTDLNGNAINLLNIKEIVANLENSETTSQFGSISVKGDFWIFSISIQNIKIDNVDVIAILKLVDIKTYADIATNMIFGNQGTTYVVNSGGVILFRPENTENFPHFQSYNLLSALRSEGVSEANINILKTSLEGNTNAQIVVEMGGETMLIQSVSDEAGRNIVLTVPISVTAKDTFDNMSFMVISLVAMILNLGILFLIWIYYFIHRNSIMRLEQAKVKSKSDFMSKMSHDIRTPLNAIVGMIEIAQRSTDNLDYVGDCLENAKKSSQYLVSLINDVLDMDRIESGKIDIVNEPFDLKDLLSTIMKIEKLPAKAKKIHLSLKDTTQGGYLYVGDSVRLKQCLMNLVSNAIKFTKEGGSIKIECQEKNIRENENLLSLSVQDTGVGMSKEFMEKMFKPFEQERSSSATSEVVGSGLGLSIVYNLISLMGGNITVESEKDRGSTFTIDLPLKIVEERIENKKDNTIVLDKDILIGKRVMVAEDNEINREIVIYYLNDLGIEVETAENGKIAFEKFINSKTGYYDLILMDIQMPEIDGIEATKMIRASVHPDAKTISIVALSANAFREDAEKCIEAGMQMHLPKPIDPTILQKVLVECITEKNKKQEDKNDK